MEKIKRDKGVMFREKVYINGRPVSKSFTRKSDALLWKRKTLNKRDHFELTGIVIKDNLTFTEFVDVWFKDKVQLRLTPATQTKYSGEIKNYFLPVIGNLKLRDITTSHANKILANLKAAGRMPRGINASIEILKGIFNDAIRWDHLTISPLRNFKLLKVDPSKDVFWTKNEIERFLRSTINDPNYPIYVLVLNSGLRKGEVAGIKWDCVSFERKTIDVIRTYSRHGLREATKTYERRTIPMNDQVQKVLWPLVKQQRSSFVFSQPDSTPIDTNHLYRVFEKAQKKAGIENKIRFHDLRHTFASHFMMNGGNLYDLQKILGHKRIEQTQRYAHLSPTHLENAIKIVSFGVNSPDLAHTEEAKTKFTIVNNA
ncbi:MAG: tyrosine-type recombinase/integrase [Oligoflexia bacterium]|nr:tyrosine-type recombinase/integrase [Oligoflexia bacterium]